MDITIEQRMTPGFIDKVVALSPGKYVEFLDDAWLEQDKAIREYRKTRRPQFLLKWQSIVVVLETIREERDILRSNG